MAIQWESFRGGEFKPNKSEISISINRFHVIRMNQAALHALGDPKALLLVYDRKLRIIGLLPGTPRNEDAFRIKHTGRSTWRINAASFCRNFGIVLDQTERFYEPFIDDQGILRLDLNRTRVTTNWRQARKKVER
jgi:hypothetical protein